MATKDDRPGLLSKVAMFVRNPTKDWSELDQPLDSDSNGYDKQALKAMIERKRQNDFVRRREFDQLRKLRDRDPVAIASLARNSYFQNSLPTDEEGRAVTLKKIDEIEAQMSRQWWRSKADGATVPGSDYPPASASLPATAPEPLVPDLESGDSLLSVPFAATEPVLDKRPGAADNAAEFIPTQMSDMASVPGLPLSDSPPALLDADDGFSASRLFAIDMDAQASDPELEEGAIRFANSDDAGAEKGLLQALRASLQTPAPPAAAQAWAAALLDLYRATHNRPAFDAACKEFAQHLEAGSAVWFALGEPEAATWADDGPDQPVAPEKIWESPARLDAQAMERLRQAMVSMPMPWSLGWQALQEIAPDAVPLLDGLFGSLCDEAVVLRFEGQDSLLRALQALTPSGARDGAQHAWRLRMNALRAMGLQDAFELAALDYCVSCGVAPPAWMEPHCRFEGASRPPPATLSGAARPAPAAAAGADTFTLNLQGQITGNTTHSLALLSATPAPGQMVVLNCRDLVRVDFAAAGNILNWVTTRQAKGNTVQFVGVNRLVAAFFHVIGINEYAKVVLRPI